jgi:hypothetical protein
MIKPGDVISHTKMCHEEDAMLQRGMNFHLKPSYSVILMSVRPGAPYVDQVKDEGKVLVYEGHDVPKTKKVKDAKKLDQPMFTPRGKLTQNGLFFEAAKIEKTELVKVYEKIRGGIWVYNGIFKLVDAWQEKAGKRKVFKFRLEVTQKEYGLQPKIEFDLDHSRLIPASVKLEVWKRDGGKCIQCSSSDNLHFDHILPFSKGGTSIKAENIQLLCARHNLEKSNSIGN